MILQNGSQFFIIFAPTPHLDGKHVVFGELVSGFSVLTGIESAGTMMGKPQADIAVEVSTRAVLDEILHACPIFECLVAFGL